ncbi:hypothetical protein KEM55_008292, partial [Ascosphaera atra]
MSTNDRYDNRPSDDEGDRYEDTIDQGSHTEKEEETERPSTSAGSDAGKALIRASPDVQTALTTAPEETKETVAKMYRTRRSDKGTQEMDRLVLSLITLGRQSVEPEDVPTSSRERSAAPGPSSVNARKKGKQVAYDSDSSESDSDPEEPPVVTRRTRQLKDIGKPPHYAGEKKDSAARRWLRKCTDYFHAETLLTGISTTEEQRVILASTWLDGTARHAWDFLCEAAHADPLLSPLPKTWKDFEDWLLLQFDELNATERRQSEFFAMKQRGKDIQDYYNSYNIAFHLAGMQWSVADRLRHFLLSLDDNLRIEWLKLKDQPETEKEILAELIRIQHFLQTQRSLYKEKRERFLKKTKSKFTQALNAATLDKEKPEKGSAEWSSWCLANRSCFHC